MKILERNKYDKMFLYFYVYSLRNMNVGNREHMDALSEQIRRKREQALVNK